MSQQPLYRIVYADGSRGHFTYDWDGLLIMVKRTFHNGSRPVRVERVSPAPRATP